MDQNSIIYYYQDGFTVRNDLFLDEIKPFQHVKFIVRNWDNFYDCWDVKQCEAQMQAQKDLHLGPRMTDQEMYNDLNRLFHEMSVFMIPQPGDEVRRSIQMGWNGALADINKDFIRFVDILCNQVFSAENVKYY